MKKRNKYEGFKAGKHRGVSKICLVLVLSGLLMMSGIGITSGIDLSSSLVPHPVYGTATWDGSGNAVGADVKVVSNYGYLTDTVGSDGSWQVDCGDPGADWPSGTSFVVSITGSGAHDGWSGQATGVKSGEYSDLGNIVVYPNKTPNTPSKPSGPINLGVGVSEEYITSTTDPNWEDQVQFQFYWGDGSYSSWTGLVDSEISVDVSNDWSKAGTYNIKAHARDEHGATSGWSSVLSVLVNDPPYTPSTPSGPLYLGVDVSGIFFVNTVDPDDHQVQYQFSWGDGNFSDWSRLVDSGTSRSMSHSWSTAGTYVVKAQARDEYDAESDWSDRLSVIVNDPPDTPSTPSGPITLKVNQYAKYSSSTVDPDGHQVQFRFDWNASGGHEYSDWADPVDSGKPGEMYYYWDTAGIYVVKAQAMDIYGNMSDWSDGLSVIVSDPPDTPSIPSGPATGDTSGSYTYSSITTDPDNHDVRYGWDWDGDGSVDDWTDFHASGTSVSISHKFEFAGSYYVQVKAEDMYGAQSGFSSALTVVITGVNNPPDTPSKPSGPTTGKHGIIHSYTTSCSDPNKDDVFYLFDWGDGTDSGWQGPYNSGAIMSVSHSWTKGNYQIKVKAKDSKGAESGWSELLSVNMPKNKQSTHSVVVEFMERVIERFPWLEQVFSLFPIFNRLFGFI